MDTVTGTTERDNLFGTEYPVVYGEVTVLSGENLSRGAVVGIVTASGKAVLLDKDAVDGSENFYAVLTADVDASAADKVGPVALCGTFQTQALSFVSGTTAADIKAAARALNCYFQDSEAANNVIGG